MDVLLAPSVSCFVVLGFVEYFTGVGAGYAIFYIAGRSGVGPTTILEWLPPALDAPLVANFDLTHFEYGTLLTLAGAPERTLRMSELAGFTNSFLSRLSCAVSRLQTRSWVERSPDPHDGRATQATMTDAGLSAVFDALPLAAV